MNIQLKCITNIHNEYIYNEYTYTIQTTNTYNIDNYIKKKEKKKRGALCVSAGLILVCLGGLIAVFFLLVEVYGRPRSERRGAPRVCLQAS